MRPAAGWVHVVVSLGAAATSVSLVLLGWFLVWFQLDPSGADRGDYALVSGLYDVGAALLALGVLAAWLSGAPRWLTWCCRCALVVLGLLAVDAHANAATAPESGSPGFDTWSDGVSTALMMPWNWLLVVALVLAVVVRARASGDRA